MPYIDSVARSRVESEFLPTTSGEVNYVLTMGAIEWLKAQGVLRYAHINHVIGSFELAMQPAISGYGLTKDAELSNSFRRTISEAVSRGVLTPADAMGALRCAQLEFYRRVAAPYEDAAIAKNGDVYPEKFGVQHPMAGSL